MLKFLNYDVFMLLKIQEIVFILANSADTHEEMSPYAQSWGY